MNDLKTKILKNFLVAVEKVASNVSLEDYFTYNSFYMPKRPEIKKEKKDNESI
ncbi:MAG: hypothetical protein ACI4GD_11315 [Lachnospiraceae bacterium]